MEFTLPLIPLLGALKQISSAVLSKHQLDAYTLIRVRSVRPGEVSFFTYNPTMSAYVVMEAPEVTGPFSFAVQEAIFSKMIAVLPKKEQTVKLTLRGDKPVLDISSSRTSYSLGTYDETLVIDVPYYEKYQFADIVIEDFVDRLKSLRFCANPGLNEDKYNAVCVNSKDFVSTDRNTLGCRPNTVLQMPTGLNLLIKMEMVDKISKFFDKCEGRGRVHCVGASQSNPSELIINHGGAYMAFRLSASSYLGYGSVIASLKGGTDLEVARKDFLEAVKRVAMIIPEGESKVVEITAGTSQVILHARNKAACKAEEWVDVKPITELSSPIRVAVDGKRLIEMLEAMGADSIVLNAVGDVRRPLVVKGGDHTYVTQQYSLS